MRNETKQKRLWEKRHITKITVLHLPSEHWYLLTWTCFQNCKQWYNALWTGIRGDLVVKLSNFFISQLSSLKTTNRIQLFIRVIWVTLMPVYHCQRQFATSLFYQVNGNCFNFATSHKNMLPIMPNWLVNAFFIRINPWKFDEKQFKIDKIIKRLFQPCTFHTL